MIFSPIAVVGISSPYFFVSSSIISLTVFSIASRLTGRFSHALSRPADQLAPVERLVAPVALQHAQVVALDFLVGREPMFAGETLPPATDNRLIFDGARIDDLIIASLTFGATHLPVVV